jgi:hypothetical protein
LETAALDTPNRVAVFITDAPAKRAPTICLRWNSGVSHFVELSYESLLNAIYNALTLALHSVNKQNIYNYKFFQCSQHKQFHSYIVARSVSFILSISCMCYWCLQRFCIKKQDGIEYFPKSQFPTQIL